MTPELPRAVADRLDGLLAGDPGLAEAVSAQLPEARRVAARDVADGASARTRVDLRS